jgi:hypothetical protein
MHKSAFNLLAVVALAAGAACTTSLVDVPPNFSQAPQVTRIFATDERARASGSTAVSGRMPAVLIYSSTGEPTSPPPPSYRRFRIEFDQPVDVCGPDATGKCTRPGAVQKFQQTDLLTTGTVGGGYSFTWCSPLDANPGVQLVDVDGGARTVRSSICYDPTSAAGQSGTTVIPPTGAHLTVVAGFGDLAQGATTNPFTCQTFRPASEGQAFHKKRTYGFKFNPATITNSNDSTKALTIPTAWAANTFTWKTAGFDIMAVGSQNSITGYFDWIAKPYAGFQSNLAPIDPTAEKDCDPTSLISTTGCRVFSDGSPFLIVTTQPVDASTVAAAVTIRRVGTNTDPDSVAQVWDGTGTGNQAPFGDRSGRTIEVLAGTTFEPGQAYVIKIDPTILRDSPAASGDAATALDTAPPANGYTFTAGPGPNGLGQNLSIVATTPGNGTTMNSPALAGGIVVQFQDGVDPSTVGPCPSPAPTGCYTATGACCSASANTFAVTAGSTTVAGSASINPGSNGQVVTWNPNSGVSAFGATYNVTVKGVKVTSTGLTVAEKGQPYPSYPFSFTTLQFAAAGIFDGAPAGDLSNEVDATRSTPLEDLVNGNLTLSFTDAADPATVSTTTVQLAQTGAATPPAYTVTDNADGTHANYVIRLTNATQQLKFGQQYVVTATTGIKEKSSASTSGSPLHAEICAAPPCNDVRGFYTQSFGPSISSPTRSGTNAGTYTVTFNYPFDVSTVTPILATNFTLVAGTYDVSRGFVGTGTKIPLTCTAASSNLSIKCAPTGGSSAVQPNTYYRAIANLTGVKSAATFATTDASGAPLTVNLDQASSTFNGTLTKDFISACTI